MGTQLGFGLLLPHFGAQASVEKCLAGAKKAELYGFHSVWVRDHLAFTPYAFEGTDNTHIEGLLLLAAVAAVTQKLVLGTAMTICHRHPIHLAQSFSALSQMAKGRIVMGMGVGGFPREFSLAGLPDALADRVQLARTNVDLCRRLWAGERVCYRDQYYDFSDVSLKPIPVNPIPIWIGGGTRAACRRAADYGDGWMPARITLATFAKRMQYLGELCQKAHRSMITIGVMPLTSIARDRKTALSHVNVKDLIDEANRTPTWVKPASGCFSVVNDIQGLLLAGNAEDIVRETRAYEAAGANHVVYDLRFRYADWYEQIDLLGQEILPALQA
jgi:alkanesulfonate monooxygenase SsuD/methylene tetrahydromethanopterin reductase-like flavin-dependent oxidoreductase (luciferase family)